MVLGLAVAAAAIWAFHRWGSPTEARELALDLRALGDRWWAPLALVAAFVVVNLTGIPGTPLTLAAGAAWGWLAGGAWTMLGILVGTAVPWWIGGRHLPSLRRLLERRFGGIYAKVDDEGMTALLILRALHVIPFAVLGYAAGLAGIRARDYFLATFLGTLPGVLVYTYLADALLEGAVSKGQAGVRVLAAGGLVVALLLATRLARRRLRLDRRRPR